MAVSLATQPDFRGGVPRLLFDAPNLTDHDLAPDGRFVFVRTRGEDPRPRLLAVVLNRLEELNRRTSNEKK